ncbi:Vitamin K-dependent gamma-carboxylase [Streptomyces sp. DvalAA-14]|uniref:HTTM domain-containing protein n=1 Tax=unclassified Streptomyces TaxID=2593676 RepID=UPI00081AFAE6|nr:MULTISPECIES: HTTM domain-containing protein [unclassified Streptomyces]MYS23468.1 HTTM domain-containing protein [Streptomyces sp. SID4948]SCE33735.1 Vitamin K-dependent gamma-carboxylase [Streptomyces sp. DvalAA-14]
MTTDQLATAAPAPGGRIEPVAGPARSAHSLLDRGFTLLTRGAVSLYAAAALRIGYGLIYLAFLLREFPHRDEIWGPDSPWTPALATELFRQTGWFSFLTLSDSRVYLDVCYLAALAVCALFMLGWRTRATSILFAVVVAAFHARAIFMTDGGDNLILLMALYLTCTASGRRWSLDARRTARRAGAGRLDRWALWRATSDLWSQAAVARGCLVTALHNCAMLVIAAQVCLLYGSAGLYKVQGASWQNGTALHYVLNLDLFRPWPALSAVADSHPLFVAVSSYLTVLLQVAFPFALFSRLKYVVLVMLLGMHLGIAVLMGLPIFSGAMIVADAAFLPDRFYRSAARLGRRALGRVRSGPPVTPPRRTGLVPTQPGDTEPAAQAP